MKTTPIRLLCLATAFVLISFCPQLRADDHGSGDCGSGQQGGDDNCQGGDIDGSETLVASVDLLPTTNAPAGAGGFAKLISDNEDGVVTSSLSLTITGLDAGVYTLSIVKKSDGSTVDLGQVQIGGCGHGGDDGDDDEGDDQGDDGDKCCSLGVEIRSQDIQLPDGVDPLDVGQLLVSDSDGNVLLMGDLVNANGTSVIKFRAKLKVGPGNLGLQITGRAQALSNARKARRIDRFTMLGYGVQPNTTFTVQVNGQDVGTVKSNRRGNVLVRKLPANLLTVRSVRLIDPAGNTAAHAKF
jgi:hypothetical protein